MGDIFEVTKKHLQKLAKTKEGQELLKQYDQTIGFEVVGKDQVSEITKKYYYPRYKGPDVIGKERFVVDVKGGTLTFRNGEDVPVPASSLEEMDKYTKILAEKQTYLDLYSGKMRPVDALVPDCEQPTRLNIWPFLPKMPYVAWINQMIKLIVKQNQ
ncbi:MAG: hypothetical protein Q8O05_02795 [Chloroflexota bacterium]|nr:hypothetical protein [Chloroflexota bacterium]